MENEKFYMDRLFHRPSEITEDFTESESVRFLRQELIDMACFTPGGKVNIDTFRYHVMNSPNKALSVYQDGGKGERLFEEDMGALKASYSKVVQVDANYISIFSQKNPSTNGLKL